MTRPWLFTLVNILFLSLLHTAPVRAQGTFYVSNLAEHGFGFSVGGGSQAFHTGPSANGYAFDSVTLQMGGWLGDASNWVVWVCSDIAGQPGTILTTLSGDSDPETAGLYVYTGTGLVLSPDTTYWIASACSNYQSSPYFPPGGYCWQFTASQAFTGSDGWSMSPTGTFPSAYLQQLAIAATAAPEPSAFALSGLAFGFALLAKRTFGRKTES